MRPEVVGRLSLRVAIKIMVFRVHGTVLLEPLGLLLTGNQGWCWGGGGGSCVMAAC